ncbi:MAG: hypothetical protein AVDCRST_MAG34-737 [uncultured Nocardioidaceae bacterium]|uniref:Uncharacterized protein n=1 Tax=uncultured Nocardioidaceae bacterium TaxID=253824 RepID=A0A6J4LS15_9ACTN|nr:MAG: hypothetical protein AVDCRST_MAG34-737 [uncultured Nocardioidaceae bacterium]
MVPTERLVEAAAPGLPTRSPHALATRAAAPVSCCDPTALPGG